MRLYRTLTPFSTYFPNISTSDEQERAWYDQNKNAAEEAGVFAVYTPYSS